MCIFLHVQTCILCFEILQIGFQQDKNGIPPRQIE